MKISIKKKLAEKNMSRYELAKRIGVTYPTISSIYNGESTSIKFEILESICKELDCSLDDILVFDGKIYVMNKRQDIIIFNKDGENNGVIKPPQGYIFSRFCNNSKFEVICEADLLNADSFGRVDYKFEYDLFCNNWERKTVVY